MNHYSMQCNCPRNKKLITRRPSKASQSESPLMRTHNLRKPEVIVTHQDCTLIISCLGKLLCYVKETIQKKYV
jgi:hypothetical protein